MNKRKHLSYVVLIKGRKKEVLKQGTAKECNFLLYQLLAEKGVVNFCGRWLDKNGQERDVNIQTGHAVVDDTKYLRTDKKGLKELKLKP